MKIVRNTNTPYCFQRNSEIPIIRSCRSSFHYTSMEKLHIGKVPNHEVQINQSFCSNPCIRGIPSFRYKILLSKNNLERRLGLEQE